MITQQNKCDRKQLCGYLKKIFIEGGEDKVNNYNDYLSKELNKKRNSVERSLELQDQKTVVTWWKEHVMKHYNREALKAAKVKKDNDRINNIASYFAKKIIAGEMSLEDIKSEAMRDITNDILNDTPFYVDNKEQTVIADRVIEPVMEERIIDKRELRHYVVRMTDTSKKDEEELNIKGIRVTYEFDALDEKDARRQAKEFDPAKRIVSVNEYVNELPEGYNYCDIATAPNGYRGATNGKSFFSSDRKTILVKEQPLQEESKEENFSHGLKVGDVLVCSWGYDQTNIDFFLIVAATEKTIRIKECSMKETLSDSHGYGSMSRKCAFDPSTAKVLDESWCIKDQKGKGDLRKIQYYDYNGQHNMYIKFKPSFGLLRKYEGEELYESWYA